MYATVMQRRGGGGGCATSTENQCECDGIAKKDTETEYTTVAMSQDRLPRRVLRQGGCPATDPLSLDLSCQLVLGRLLVMHKCCSWFERMTMGVVDGCIALHCPLIGKWPPAAGSRFWTPCALVWPSSTWHVVGLCPTNGAMSACSCLRTSLRQFSGNQTA